MKGHQKTVRRNRNEVQIKHKTQQLYQSWKRLQQSLILQMTKLKAREVNGCLGSQVINQTFLTLSSVLSTSFQEYPIFRLTEFFLILYSVLRIIILQLLRILRSNTRQIFIFTSSLSYIYWGTNLTTHVYTFFSILTATTLDGNLQKENSLLIMNISNMVYYQFLKR